MDKGEPHDRLMPLINALAIKAIALPAGERTAFVNSRIAAMKRTDRRAYAADAAVLALALYFAETIRERGLRLTGMIEGSGGNRVERRDLRRRTSTGPRRRCRRRGGAVNGWRRAIPAKDQSGRQRGTAAPHLVNPRQGGRHALAA
jgi:hypothetical protein